MTRLTTLLATGAAVALLSGAASAQSYGYNNGYSYGGDRCGELQNQNRVAGAVVGGLLGAALGNGVAADNTKTEGSVLGGLLGAAIGSEVGKRNADCVRGVGSTYQTGSYGSQYGGYASNTGYVRDLDGGPYYGGSTYDRGYSYGSTTYGQPTYGGVTYGQPTYGTAPRGAAYGHPANRHRDHAYRTSGTTYGTTYGSNPNVANRQCETTTQITVLPDGREIHEPVTVCREAYYNDWQVARR